jgi:hypothetical protein
MSARPLTLDQRARRAATRKNNQIARRYPLFADEFATTVEAERERILRQEEQGKRVIARLEKLGLEHWAKGQQLRRVAQLHVPAGVFAERDASFEHIYGHKAPEWAGTNLADFWWQVLRNHAPADIKRQHCPHADHHHDLRYWPNGPCPACGIPWIARVAASSLETTS